jgi:putative phosphoesterase
MRIGVISDTHLNSSTSMDLPKEVSEAFQGVDMIIHAGDLVDLGVLEQLKKICPNVKAVSGNMDNSGVMTKLPEKEIIRAGNFRIGLMHGWGPPNRLTEVAAEAFKNDGVDMIIFGHSHRALNEKIGGIIFFNPGSPTDKVYTPYNTYGIIEINDAIEAKIVRMKDE